MQNKTWKRELGLLFAVILCYEVYTNNVEMVEVIVWPFVTFIAAAAGLHIYGKLQRNGGTFISNRGRTQRSGQRTGREDEQPDCRCDGDSCTDSECQTQGTSREDRPVQRHN